MRYQIQVLIGGNVQRMASIRIVDAPVKTSGPKEQVEEFIKQLWEEFKKDRQTDSTLTCFDFSKEIHMRNISLVVLVLMVTCVCQASPIMTNASFETGDFSGWNLMLQPDHMNVVTGTASDGQYYATADIQWMYHNSDGIPAHFSWQAGCWTEIAVPVGVTKMSFDVRATSFNGSQMYEWTLGLSGGTQLQFMRNTIHSPLTLESLSNGWTRYTMDITGADAFESIFVSVIASGTAYDRVPIEDSTEFSIDNFVFTPEPATMLLLFAGGVAMLKQRK